MNVRVKRETQEIDAEEILHKTVKRFSKSSAHITLPVKWLNREVTVILNKGTIIKKRIREAVVGNAMSRWGKEMERRAKQHKKEEKEMKRRNQKSGSS